MRVRGFRFVLRVLGPGFFGGYQGFQTRALKVVAVKVALNILVVWPLCYLKDLIKGPQNPGLQA